MPLDKVRWLVVPTIATLLVGQLGCAPHAPTVRSFAPSPPSEQFRAQLGTIGLVSARSMPEAELEGFTSGQGYGAAEGAKGGAIIAFAIGASPAVLVRVFPPAILAIGIGIALAPIGALVGGVHGAVTADSAAKATEAQLGLKNAFADLNVQDAMRDRVMQVARERSGRSLVPLVDKGPTAREEKADYRPLTSERVDTVLEVGVLSLGLAGETGVNRRLALVMTVRTRLLRVADGTELYEQTFEYRSGAQRFSNWAVSSAQPFRDELDHAYQRLADEIVQALFSR